VVDTLSKMITKAKQHGYIKGLGNFEGDSLVNLNFADDTLIFLTADTKIVDAFKMLLIGFKNLLGLKINYTKSELIPLNLSESEGTQLANILGSLLELLLLPWKEKRLFRGLKHGKDVISMNYPRKDFHGTFNVRTNIISVEYHIDNPFPRN
jgi:hypothetical protein